MTDLTPAKQPVTPSPVKWLRDEIDRLFDDVGRSAGDLGRLVSSTLSDPAAEMIERGKDYRLSLELPGIKEDDVRITVTEGCLVIAGEKREDDHRREGQLVISERRYGTFERRLTLPQGVDQDKIEAHFSKGVLTVILPKGQDAPDRVKRIEIRKS